ncbi:MAG TPA: hypothetical protein VGQ92_11380 [Actinoplanes sp.]|nr:hypothetical protein [Actinoplanes sp.]
MRQPATVGLRERVVLAEYLLLERDRLAAVRVSVVVRVVLDVEALAAWDRIVAQNPQLAVQSSRSAAATAKRSRMGCVASSATGSGGWTP